MFSLLRSVAPTLAVAAAACVVSASPAHAASATLHDRAGDISQSWDLRDVTVRNGARNVWVKVSFHDLAPDKVAGASVFLDTDNDKRPDFVLSAGLFDGTDYQLAETKSWNVHKQGKMLNCSYRLWLDYPANTARVRLSKACLSSAPGEGPVRVEVRSSGQNAQGKPVVDWLGKARSFSRPVAQG